MYHPNSPGIFSIIMKPALTFIILFITFSAFAQQMTLEEWDKESKTNIRLLPKYGWQTKTISQKEADETFINQVINRDEFKGNRTAAAGHMIRLGFDYLSRGDVKTAMYRFNQAYLLGSTYSDIYWGYGAVFMTLGDYGKAKAQYEHGLSVHPASPHILTDYGTYFLAQYYGVLPIDEKGAKEHLTSAINNLLKSYNIDKKDQNTLFKLSVCYLLKEDCGNAWRYYTEKEAGGQPITKEYTSELKSRCKK